MVTNRVYKVLCTNGTVAASVAALTAGQVVVVKRDGTPFAAGNTIAQGESFQVVVAAPDGTRIFSDWINIKDIIKYEKTAYRARVEQVIDVTVATPTAGTEYQLVILNLQDKEILQRRQNKQSYSVVASATDTATTIAASFVSLINADPAAYVTATSSAGDITLTAKAVETTANIAGEYQDQVFFDAKLGVADPNLHLIKFGTVAYTTNPDFGSGNYDQIKKWEQRSQGYQGITNRTRFPIEAGLYTSVLGTNYDVYAIEANREYNSNSATFAREKSPVALLIGVTAGAGTALENVLTPLITSAPLEGLNIPG